MTSKASSDRNLIVTAGDDPREPAAPQEKGDPPGLEHPYLVIQVDRQGQFHFHAHDNEEAIPQSLAQVLLIRGAAEMAFDMARGHLTRLVGFTIARQQAQQEVLEQTPDLPPEKVN